MNTTYVVSITPNDTYGRLRDCHFLANTTRKKWRSKRYGIVCIIHQLELLCPDCIWVARNKFNISSVFIVWFLLFCTHTHTPCETQNDWGQKMKSPQNSFITCFEHNNGRNERHVLFYSTRLMIC